VHKSCTLNKGCGCINLWLYILLTLRNGQALHAVLPAEDGLSNWLFSPEATCWKWRILDVEGTLKTSCPALLLYKQGNWGSQKLQTVFSLFWNCLTSINIAHILIRIIFIDHLAVKLYKPMTVIKNQSFYWAKMLLWTTWQIYCIQFPGKWTICLIRILQWKLTDSGSAWTKSSVEFSDHLLFLIQILLRCF
jgi:hypothetical protein